MQLKAFLLVVVMLLGSAGSVWAQSERPTQQQVERFISGAVMPFRTCLQRSLPAPPRPNVLVTIEFASEGGFPMPMEIQARPGSAIERCIGEALVELSAPPIPGPPLRVQCQVPLVNSPRVRCRLASNGPRPPRPGPPAQVAPPRQPSQPQPQPAPPPQRPQPSPTPPPPPQQAPPPPQQAPQQPQPPQEEPPLSRGEVATAMARITTRVAECVAELDPPPIVRLRVSIDGEGHVALIEALPTPPPSATVCIADAVASLEVRSTGRPPFRVLYPVRIR